MQYDGSIKERWVVVEVCDGRRAEQLVPSGADSTAILHRLVLSLADASQSLPRHTCRTEWRPKGQRPIHLDGEDLARVRQLALRALAALDQPATFNADVQLAVDSLERATAALQIAWFHAKEG